MFAKVAVIGTGLIGGSLAMAIKKKGLAEEVVGVSRKRSTLAAAKRSGAIDRGSPELGIIRGADLLVFAAPVGAIMGLAAKAARFAGKECIVIDVGSTKAEIVSRLEKVFPNYLGCHPLAGSEKKGVLNADPAIFRGSLCILTPTRRTAAAVFKKVRLLWGKVGARTVSLDPKAHDRILAFTSHLPHIAAFALISSVPAKYLPFSSTGLKDTTRIAASDNEVWQEIIFSNRSRILDSIDVFQQNISRIKSAIQRKDAGTLVSFLLRAKNKRGMLISDDHRH